MADWPDRGDGHRVAITGPGLTDGLTPAELPPAGPPRETSASTPARGAVQALVVAAGLAAVTLAAYTKFLSAGFAATDSLPLIETSRFTSLSGAAALFTRPVMAGTRFALGEVVYRPFVSVTFGLDYALWGLHAAGFHATNLGLHLLGVLGVMFLLTRLGLQTWSAATGAAMFALHPLVVASVPVIARRDSVVPVTAFVLGAGLLISAEQTRGIRRAWRLVGCVVLVGVALTSKESAFAALVMLPMLFVTSVFARGGSLRDALGGTRLLMPVVVLALGVFVMRLVVLRGLGHAAEDSNLLDLDWYRYSQILGAFTRELAWTVAWIAPSTRELWPRLAGLSLVGLALTVPWLPRRYALVAAAGVVWVVGFAVFCMALKIATIAWLAYFALVGLAMLVGAGLEGAAARLCVRSRGRSGALRCSAAAGLLAALGLYCGMAVYGSTLVRNYDQWQIAGDVTQRFTQALEACVAGAPSATQVQLNALPSSFDDGRFETNLMGVTLLEDWTVDAILRLSSAERDLTVHVSSWGTLRAGADTLRFTCSQPAPDRVELTTSY